MNILFNDGEGLEHGDLNLQRDLYLRLIYDLLGQNMSAPEMVQWALDGTNNIATSQIRPLRNAGSIASASGSTVNIRGGLFLQVDYSTALTADGPTALIGHLDAETAVTGFTAASATTYRRDIIQARVISQNEAAVGRDFKDAVTGALSTSSIVKRANIVVELSRKAGTEFALQADADNPANEVAPDTGYHKLLSVLVDDTGLTTGINDRWDWRMPWGFSHARTISRDFFWDFTKSFRYVVSATGFGGVGYVNNDVDVLYVDCPLGLNMSGNTLAGTVAETVIHPFRIQRMNIYSDFVAAPVATDVQAYTRNVVLGDTTKYADLGTTVGTGGFTPYPLYEHTTVTEGTVKPLWSSGLTHPDISTGSALSLKITTADILDRLYGTSFEAWGGF